MILWFSTPTQKFVWFLKNNAQKYFFITDSARSDRGLSIPLLFTIFWIRNQKLHWFEQIVHSKIISFLTGVNFFVKHQNTFLTPDLEYSEQESSEYIYFWLSHSSVQKVTCIQKNLWHIWQVTGFSYFDREIYIYISLTWKFKCANPWKFAIRCVWLTITLWILLRYIQNYTFLKSSRSEIVESGV